MDRLWERVDKSGECWLWTGGKSHGYGVIKVNGAMVRVHRLVWSMQNGIIPDNLVIDHLCCVKNCVRPDHLEAVTQAENVRRWYASAPKTDECHRGHPFSIENTRFSSDGRRHCRACARDRTRRWRAA